MVNSLKPCNAELLLCICIIIQLFYLYRRSLLYDEYSSIKKKKKKEIRA